MMAKEPPSKKQIFLKTLSQLGHCPESEQKQKIGEMNEIIDEMNVEEFKSVFTTRMFNKMDKLIEEKKLQLGNAILLLKHAGFCKALKRIWIEEFEYSTLNERFEKMISEEEGKKDEKNEKLLTEICECYLLFNIGTSSQLISICVPCLLKIALKKEENKETLKEVEMTLLALATLGFNFIEQKLYLEEIKEIIKYHQEHRNLTRLAYQSAMQFLIHRLFYDMSLESVIVNELHFVREATRELEELARCVDWKKKEGERKRKDIKEELAITRWLQIFEFFFRFCGLRNEEYIELFSRIVQVYRVAKDNRRDIGKKCICFLGNAAEIRDVRVENLLKGGAVDVFLEEIQRQTMDDEMVHRILMFFVNASMQLKEEERKEMKRKVFEKMEEEGYEDTITSFHEIFDFLCKKYYDEALLNVSDFRVNV